MTSKNFLAETLQAQSCRYFDQGPPSARKAPNVHAYVRSVYFEVCLPLSDQLEDQQVPAIRVMRSAIKSSTSRIQFPIAFVATECTLLLQL